MNFELYNEIAFQIDYTNVIFEQEIFKHLQLITFTQLKDLLLQRITGNELDSDNNGETEIHSISFRVSVFIAWEKNSGKLRTKTSLNDANCNLNLEKQLIHWQRELYGLRSGNTGKKRCK